MSYVSPENVIKNAMEFKEQGNFMGALEELHQILHGKKFRGNNIVLERVMIEMIEICADNLTTQYLKEDIGHFRNTCQHTNMELLKNVLKKLKERNDELIKRTEEEDGGEDRLRQLLSVEIPAEASAEAKQEAAASAFLSGDVSELGPEDLILLASCGFEQVEARQGLMQRVAFFIEVCKIILDTLRQNSKMLDFYNQTAQRVFDFCSKYGYKAEYQKVSETLHSHFAQILKLSKHPELFTQSKIPFPVRLDEEDALQKVLELRYHQLKIALRMRVWSDAFRTTENIYQLINRQKHHHSRMKQILHDFFANLAEIFWQSEFFLFHAYSVMNLQSIIKFNKTLSEEKKGQMTAQFVLAVLSVPLNNRLSNFERLSVQYVPPGMEQLQESTSAARNELFSIANMLQVKGVPSRGSLINYLKVKNLHLQPDHPEIQELFRLIEEEESPFTISKKGREMLDRLGPQWAQYRPFLVKTLSVRILQKCRNYFKNLKMSTLSNLLQFFSSFADIEFLLFECNREGLVSTCLDHRTQSVTFDQEQEIQSSLLRFGKRLRDAFQHVQEITSEGGERERIFLKVKEKIEQEMADVLRRKADMDKMKEDILRNQAEETRTLQEIFSAQQQEKERHFAQLQVKEEKERQRNKLLEELELMRRIRAQEVLAELARRGVKKIGAVKISDMERKGEFDYDEVMSYYQMLLKREKEAFEGEKTKKLKDVEYWARAVREEEKVAIEKYAREHGEEEMKQIQRAVRERHEKELKMKHALEKAQGAFVRFREKEMERRKQVHEAKTLEFVAKKGAELQAKVVEEAKNELKKVENLRKVKEADEQRRRILLEKEKKNREEGKTVEGDAEEIGWGRQQVKQPDVGGPREPKSDAVVDLGRSGFGKGVAAASSAPEEKKEEPRRPMFTRGPKKEESGTEAVLNRTGMGSGQVQPPPPRREEEKKEITATKSSETAGPWRQTQPLSTTSSAPTTSGSGTAAAGGSGFTRGPPGAAKKEEPKKNEKGDDSWSNVRKPGGFINSSKK